MNPLENFEHLAEVDSGGATRFPFLFSLAGKEPVAFETDKAFPNVSTQFCVISKSKLNTV